MEQISGYTCNRCGKVFDTEEEFINRHNKKIKTETNENQSSVD